MVELVFLIWNIFVLALYGTDKLCARKRIRRIREITLITTAFLMGGTGAMFGMVLFNHKTSKIKFRVLVPVAVVLNIAVAIVLNFK